MTHATSSDPDPDSTSDIADAAVPDNDLEHLTRPLLKVLSEVTGMESTYLTVIHWEDSKQEILFSRNAGAIRVDEGLMVDWSDTLCRRALQDGRVVTPDVAQAWGTDHAAAGLGFRTYASVPIVTADRSIYGTLCAASTSRRDLGDSDVRIMQMFARLIADQVEREEQLGVERSRTVAAETRTMRRAMLLAAAEHKVKTPLAVIRGAASTLVDAWDDLPDSQRRELAEVVVRQGESLRECIEMMLQQSRAEVAAAELRLHAFRLEPELVRIAADHSLVSELHRVAVRCDANVICVADVASLDQVLGHLIDNAIKYSPAGGDIEISVRHEGDVLVISVLDHGPGLPPGDLFLPFERGGRTSGTGTGLGLHVVHTLVEAMGGSVAAGPGPDGGALFEVTLGAG